MGKMRTGIVSFTTPIYYHFRTLNTKNEYKIRLLLLMTPVSIGITRLHLAFMGSGISNNIPIWLSHSFGNKFLETDVWLHNCEIEAVNKMKINNITLLDAYYTPTTSDIGPVIWRKWWLKHLSHIPIFSNEHDINLIELSSKQQKDRTSHIENCKHCQQTLYHSKILKRVSYLSIFLKSKNPIYSASFFILLRLISYFLDRMVHGEK